MMTLQVTYLNSLFLFINFYRREQEHRNGGEGEGEDVSTPRLSMQERIYQMQNKLEEAKSCPITPRAKSGTTTPKLTFKGR